MTAAGGHPALFSDAEPVGAALGQFSTPPWAIGALLERFFPSFGPDAFVIEPSCGFTVYWPA